MMTTIGVTAAMMLMSGIAKFLVRDWCHPATVFCLVWACGCGGSILLAPENISSPSGTIWILLNMGFVVAGGVGGTAAAYSSLRRRSAQRAIRSPPPVIWSHRSTRRLTFACILLGLIFVPLCIGSQGIGADQLLSLKSLARTAMRMSIGRYSKAGQPIPKYVELFLTASYLAPLLGGTLFVRRQRKSDTLLSVLTLFPCVAAFAAQSTKASVLYGGTMWVAGYLSTRPYYGKKAQTMPPRVIAIAIAGSALVLLLFSVGDALRGGGEGVLSLEQDFLTQRAKTSLGGHLPALSQWLDRTDFSEIDPGLGRYTFAGLYQLAGAGERPLGMYGESVILPTGVTNVYTYFRELIDDATMPGALLAIFALGFCGGFAYRRALERKPFWMGILAACYAETIFGVTSLFNYNSVLLAVVLYGVWWAAPWRRHERSRAVEGSARTAPCVRQPLPS